MTWIAEHGLVLTMFAAYTALLCWHGYEGLRGAKTVSDYYVGGRGLGGFAIGMSFFATYVSTNTFVGLAGQSYSYGVSWLLFGVFFVVFSLLAWILIAPKLLRFTRQLGAVTFADYIGLRFDSQAARVVAALIVGAASVLYMVAIYKGIGGALAQFLGLDYTTAIIAVLIITVAYTAAGGFVSVVRTDVIQGGLVIIAAVMMFYGVVDHAGGLDSIRSLANREGQSGLLEIGGTLPMSVMLGIFVAGAMKLLVDPRQLSRFYGLVNQQAIRTGMWVSTVGLMVTFAMLLPIGLYARVFLPGTADDTDAVVPAVLASGIFSDGVAAFLLVAMVAAAMSSLDSVLLVTASTVERDLLGLRRPSLTETATIRRTQWHVLWLSVLTAAIAWSPPAGIVALTTWAGGLFAACFFPSILLGLNWHRGDGIAVLASYSAGTLMLLLWGLSPLSRHLHEVFPALAASVAAYVIVAAVRRPAAISAALFPPTDRQ